MAVKNIKMKEGNNILYPQTKIKNVIDDDGKTLEEILASMQTGGGIGGDITPTPIVNFRIRVGNWFQRLYYTDCTAEEGMTWAAWCSSSYCVGDFYIDLNGETVFVRVLSGDTIRTYEMQDIKATDVILDGKVYKSSTVGSAV